jgi:steroid delta-isomerase-like uncharacterized protein
MWKQRRDDRKEGDMDALRQAQLYFDAWNRHHSHDVLSTFAPGGTYEDPTTPEPVSGEAIAQQVDGLVQMFPDVAFEVVNAGATSERTVAAEWVMRGTHSQPVFGAPPTGNQVELHGADFVVVSEEGIVSVRGYYNEPEYLRQLGLKVHALPVAAMGPVSFGTGTYVQSGKVVKPGAVSITALTVRDEGEATRVEQISMGVIEQMLGMKGFLALTAMTFGDRMMTVTTWESPDDPPQLLASGAHREGVRLMYQQDFSLGGMLSVWKPERVYEVVRCPECSEFFNPGETGACSNGHSYRRETPWF